MAARKRPTKTTQRPTRSTTPAKQATKPAAKPVAKPAAKPKARPAARPVAKPAAKAKGSKAPVPAPLAPRFHRFALPRQDDGVRYWLFKTEPDVFSFDDLMRAPARTTCWDGVRNFQVRNFMRDHMRVGDLVFIYHSNAEPPAVAGIATVASAAYPDHTAFDPNDVHYDPKSDRSAPTWLMVDVQGVRAVGPVTLPTMRGTAALATMELLQLGSRLSITPLTPEEWAGVMRLAGE